MMDKLCSSCKFGKDTLKMYPDYCPWVAGVTFEAEDPNAFKPLGEHKNYILPKVVMKCKFYEELKEDNQMSALNDGGDRVEFKGGGLREPADHKGRYDLISPVMLARLAQHYENGAIKYAERNWEKGLPMSRCFDSCIRHLFRYLEGDNSEDHLAAAIWNISALMHYEKYLPKNSQFRDMDTSWRGTQRDSTQYSFPQVSADCAKSKSTDSVNKVWGGE